MTFSETAENGQNGGLFLGLNNGEQNKDFSRYIEKGALEILLEVENYAEHPTQILNVRMESPAGHSMTYSLPEGFADNSQQSYTIPLNKLFTKADGQIDHVVLQNIEKALVIQPQPISDKHNLRNMSYKVGEVKLIWDYTPEA
ncbi:hypothetical protein [Endozoicomonas lisbonensis]|uniref:Uncharacterized protein n=1 Tax=Endozoicomonas lisbonensis TaxID=3120522 RepID=A0ABV2SLR0_9GAMM